ncbi:class I SAM-dependent methyltransferase [Pseudomaricurvus sp.]|uniref:class I SAM-dependent methyltransferase n=1 Tax=Pseudomaricurvus sp. TaxID=2004510 RepID=UPI003F6D7DF8
MKHSDIEFTGERFVPGKSGDRIEADHMARYSFSSKFSQGKKVLDIACGSGYSAPIMIEAGAETYMGVDVNESAIKHARLNYGSDLIQYEVGDITKFNNGVNYDLITCFETIEHITCFESAIENLSGLQTKGGILLVSSPYRPVTSPKAKKLSDRPSNKFHTQEFVPEELLALLNKYGYSTNEACIYGQRLRKHYPIKLARKIHSAIFGNPNKVSSPKVEKIQSGYKPKYFLIVAEKV